LAEVSAFHGVAKYPHGKVKAELARIASAFFNFQTGQMFIQQRS